MSAREIFDAEFLEGLKTLRMIVRRVPGGGRFAEHRSRDLGAGDDFRDYRAYTPGDDLEAIDWNIYARLGKVVLRLFEELEDLPVYLLVDTSRSLWVETPPRIHAGLRVAAGLACIALDQLDRAGVYPFAGTLAPGLEPRAGAARLHEILEFLVALEPGHSTDLARAVSAFGQRRLRSGLLVLVSDFFDPQGLDRVFAELVRLRHRVLLVALERSEDRAPALRGDLRLVDAESGASQDVTVDDALLARYRERYDAFSSSLAHGAESRGYGFLRIDADRPILDQLATLFAGKGFVV